MEKKKDELEVSKHKEKLIAEIKRMDFNKMFSPPPKAKTSFLSKTLKIFGLK